MRMNNVDVAQLQQTLAEIQQSPEKAKRVTRVAGEWQIAEHDPQFIGVLKYENGEIALEADQPTFMGGGGRRPGPLHYCLYGLASCYAGTFVTTAAMQGVRIDKLAIEVAGHFNFSRVFGLSDAPALEQVHITLTVTAQASQEQLAQIEKLARQRCPAAYTLSNPVPLEVEVRSV
jgi:uncharacterized OsmC-like protein